MIRSAPLPGLNAGGPCDGPIVARLRRELEDAGIVVDEIAVSERSPYGQRALRLRLGGADAAGCGETARCVAAMSWAGDVAAVPPNLYVRLPTGVMREWAGITDDRVPAPASQRITVIHADPDALSDGPLDVLRHVCTGRAIAALLRSVGCEVTIESSPARASNAFATRSEVRLRLWGGEVGQCETSIGVAGVDLPQGRLRARYGGMLQVRDLLRELDGHRSDEGYGLALASFLMLSCPRGSRLKLDEAKLGAGVAAFATLVKLAGIEEQPASTRQAGGNEVDLANLLLALDATPAATRRSLVELEPCHLLRHLRGLAFAADIHLAAGDPLRGRLAETLSQGLDHLALDPGEAPPSRPSTVH